jgi:hypothetical protein
VKPVFSFRDPHEAGYLRRQFDNVALRQEIVDMQQTDMRKALDLMVEYLLKFIVEPKGDEAREAILDMSKEEFMVAFADAAESSTPPNSSGPSGIGPGATPKKRHGKR